MSLPVMAAAASEAKKAHKSAACSGALPPCFFWAQSSSKAAEDFAATKGDVALRAASRRLRSSCDACHTLYLRKYEPPKVKASDAEFDFNSALPPKK